MPPRKGRYVASVTREIQVTGGAADKALERDAEARACMLMQLCTHAYTHTHTHAHTIGTDSLRIRRYVPKRALSRTNMALVTSAITIVKQSVEIQIV